MPQIKKLLSLAARDIEPSPPSWAIVNFLLIKNNFPASGNLGAVVAASAEATIFSYNRDSIEPMYFCTIGGEQRLKLCTGFNVKGLRTTDSEKAFSHIREGIDAGQGLFMAGPEIGLCYGYDDPGSVEKRQVYGFTNWGPAFNGALSWQHFIKYVETFGEAEGFAYLEQESEPAPVNNILSMLCETVIDWQNQHPAVQFGMKQEYYGLTAFKQFIEDVSNPDMRSQIDEAYLNCHVIQFQSAGRYWLGQYFEQLSGELTGDMRRHLQDIAKLYDKIYTDLKRFIEFDITKVKQETEIRDAVKWLETAYNSDEKILEKFMSLRNLL